MGWGDVPAWVAFALSLGAFGVSIKARGDGKRSAEAAVRSADAAEAALAHQRAEADERRQAEAEAALPRVELAIEYVADRRYRLVNHGLAVAEDITLVDHPALLTNQDFPVSLGRNEGVDFIIAPAMGVVSPPHLFARWRGQADPVSLRVPSAT